MFLFEILNCKVNLKRIVTQRYLNLQGHYFNDSNHVLWHVSKHLKYFSAIALLI